ncbi:hypothetical protein GCM10011344_25810 [Dokdonia pacifica]|uniref:Phospholipase_D-nuclease N-terminal n=1 Tax=Dokdonia pacifica TaxID=1627892 RepID=A0A238WSG4_9FLAO|nr:hypothetical protein [Dokdonia pacifica]GGG23859.1 hypothetical protein GCM10011344_25810 [Dokdonia pacifica]SNR49496.1 hypothetical protein SAMN06265376_1011438 [Dokdonia pacifica]
MDILVQIIPTIILIYLAIGLVFGIYFFIRGAAQLDALIKDSKWTVRLLLVPGAIGLWPLLLSRLLKPSKTNL